MGGNLVEEQHGRPPVTRRKEPSIGEQHRDQERLLFAGGAERGRKPARPVRGREIAALGALRGAALRILLPARVGPEGIAAPRAQRTLSISKCNTCPSFQFAVVEQISKIFSVEEAAPR